MDDTVKIDVENYKELMKRYIETKDEQSLYEVEQVSKSFIKNHILPDEIVNMHIQALAELYPSLSEDIQSSMNFLLEAMIAYGIAHQEYQMLREKQSELKSEISVAASMQETLLGTIKPEIEGLDIGVISVPAHQMNGDYHHFVKGSDGSLGIAMADVIGKGIPAALCMSMIKYAMDSYPEEAMEPRAILKNLNRVVERNVDPSMFITMCYAQYIPSEHTLRYASAGHEPGFYYNAEKDIFEEMETKGLVLGVTPDADYGQYELNIHKNDLVIMLTDGVTECRDGDRFIESEEVLSVIRQYAHLPAQEMVNQVFKYFERLQNFELRDDFTLLILRREV
ncbi:MAG: PP2C family protein-serine/threonine phosphatase [Bacillota bacterium]|uniref:PP2C family protein-serine/threonine phosphatase n=1 Tax=Virgibacillus salarius TaxID=447199 RepID=A0A941DT67_9BACI|nr:MULTISPECIES: PP2C family protein-serine/threonine phosphatase [Bacillaceae]NAZ08958.1 SpoIIE family protein phosphatase [Agaribacter marinus]MBR7796250.1 PP2C family protein-serine/threonine phosphatase [Virgibacillus salarius]MCC2251647.1 PP2C family protein-serine/threonine phosphatase [Virgibacillus sp. AGTR]MDY7045159.1 PP2C family protein-serine/threonine phosphatase [Virgibacillus sp. M23]QRZ19680.1 PP2C family protein-serine/threonine phosphatase [Virgibacillus sp. AGTR]